MRSKQGLLLIALVCAAAAALLVFGASSRAEPDYTSFSTQTYGTSLLYDTLRKMDYPVSVMYEPVNAQSAVNDAYIIIQPEDPVLNEEQAAEILQWVRRGGRLIYLEDYYPTVFDEMLEDYEYTDWEDMTYYPVGMGAVVVGFAEDVVNQNLMDNSLYGALIGSILDDWNADHIFFVEYYHGYRTNDNLFTHLPLVIKLGLVQIVLCTAAYAWFKGKRFGKPIPYYEEIERDENEHVRAMARLLYKTGGYKK